MKMKILFSTFSLGILIYGNAYSFMQAPEQELARAEMKAVASTGEEFAEVRYATVALMKNWARGQENTYIRVYLPNQSLRFDIEETLDAGCGSVEYSAIARRQIAPHHREASKYELTLVDHRFRKCHDRLANYWEVKINNITASGRLISALKLTGTVALDPTPDQEYIVYSCRGIDVTHSDLVVDVVMGGITGLTFAKIKQERTWEEKPVLLASIPVKLKTRLTFDTYLGKSFSLKISKEGRLPTLPYPAWLRTRLDGVYYERELVCEGYVRAL